MSVLDEDEDVLPGGGGGNLFAIGLGWKGCTGSPAFLAELPESVA
jgi:hypothetical protein